MENTKQLQTLDSDEFGENHLFTSIDGSKDPGPGDPASLGSAAARPGFDFTSEGWGLP